jgi:phosphoribosyl-ATP pyrophosphohydrolase/phosphoribosyl-AMP cyclohydrolase
MPDATGSTFSVAPGFDPDALDWDKQGGLLPAVVQDAASRRVLMLGYMNRAALARTIESGDVTFWSRSKGRLWTKGESSGHRLALTAIQADCDADALLLQVELVGAGVCHTGARSCFLEADNETLRLVGAAAPQ